MRLTITTRFSKSGNFYVEGFDPSGKRIRKSLKTKDACRAEELRSDLEKKLWILNLYGEEAVATFDQAALAYAEDGGETRFLLKVSEHFAGVLLRKITPNIIKSAAKKVYPKHGAATLNRQFITPAQSVINYAHQQGWCQAIRVTRFRVERPKREAVGVEYLVALQKHAPVNLFALMFFIYTTGRRVGDAIGLTPDDVDLGAAKVIIGKTKNGDPATASLVPMLVDIIKGLPKYENGHLFGYKNRSGLYNTLRRSCKKAGIKYLGTHQPGRHSFATNLHQIEGWDSKQIADAGGWKSPRLVDETYIHTNEPAKKAAELIGKKLAKKLVGNL
jgi:integrase